jgi:hypothetical protein
VTEHPNTETAARGKGRHLDEDLCLDLVHGLLPAAEEERVLSHLHDCPECEELFRETVIERERLRAAKRVRFAPDGRLVLERRAEPVAGAADETPRSEIGKLVAHAWTAVSEWARVSRWRPALALAVPLALAILVLWPHSTEMPDSSSLHWLPSASEFLRLRAGGEAGEGDELARGLEAYSAGDLRAAIERLEAGEATGPLETIRRIYLGSALAWSGRYAEAAALLETVSPQELPDPWSGETRWTLYVALRGSGRAGAADSLLRVMADGEGEIAERARRQQESWPTGL